jgi:putative heme-binding domain-containing protein
MLRHRSFEDLVYNILDPNMAINPNYATYRVEAEEIETGLMKSQSEDAVVLLQAQGITRTIPKSQIKKVEVTEKSLMPEGMESGMTPQELRDLLEYLHAERK